MYKPGSDNHQQTTVWGAFAYAHSDLARYEKYTLQTPHNTTQNDTKANLSIQIR